MNKEKRQNIVKELINLFFINSQEALLQMLLEKGVDVTQATLSRDIKELKIVKAPMADGKYSYQLPNTISQSVAQSTSFVKDEIEFSGNLAVLKTRPGYAMAIAGEIDQVSPREILGTVAGDDTILLVVRENVARQDVLTALSKIINL